MRLFRLLLLMLALSLGAAAFAQEVDDEGKRAKIRDALRRAKAAGEAGRRIRQLEEELQASALWVQKAVLLVELADTKDRRAVAVIGAGLADKHPHVSAFALRSLATFSSEDVRKGGGAELYRGLLDALKVKRAYHRRVAQEVLTAFVGKDLGRKAGPWKTWLKKHEAELGVEIEDLSFDPKPFDPDEVKEVVEADQGATTAVAPRLPNVTQSLERLGANGLDLALCLDQTSSMGGVIDECKSKLDLLMAVLAEVVKDHRIGLVTYDDAVKIRQPLARPGGRLLETLDQLKAIGGDDIPEGVDKALFFALGREFGWRKRTARVVVVIGDAPPHEPDVAPTVAHLEKLTQTGELTVHMVSTGPATIPEFDELAKAGQGSSLLLSQPNKLIAELLVLIFGKPLRPAMERFVPALLEILAEQRG